MVTRHPERDRSGTSLAAIAGSMAGCLVLYYIGRKGGEALVRKRFTGDRIERAMAALRRYGVMAVLIPSLLPPPAPFKIFVLLAGVVGISVARFATAIAIGRGVRYLALGHPGGEVRRAGRGAYIARARHRGRRWSSSASSWPASPAICSGPKRRTPQNPITIMTR